MQQNHQWQCIVVILNKFLPTEGTIQPEVELKQLKRGDREILRDFTGRFFNLAKTMITLSAITDRRSPQVILKKLLKRVINSLAILDFEQCTLKKLKRRVNNYVNGTALAPKEGITKEKLEDFMDIDTVNSMLTNSYDLNEPSQLPLQIYTATLTAIVDDDGRLRLPRQIHTMKDTYDFISTTKLKTYLWKKTMDSLDGDQSSRLKINVIGHRTKIRQTSSPAIGAKLSELTRRGHHSFLSTTR